MAEGGGQDHLRPGKKPVCDLCDNETDFQLSKCLDCNLYMCRTCTTGHKRVPAAMHHDIISGVERGPSKSQGVSRMCKSHKKEEITLFCTTCNDFICTECIIGNHKSHDLVKFKDVASRKRREMNTKLCEAVDAQKSEIENITKQIEDKEKLNDENEGETEKLLDDRKAQLIAEVDRIFKDLAERKTKIHQKNRDKLAAVRAQITQGSPEFNVFCSKYKELLRTGSDMEVVVSETEMYQNLDSIPSPYGKMVDITINKSSFIAGRTDAKSLESFYGSVRSDAEESSELCTDLKVISSTFHNKMGIVISICPLSEDNTLIHYNESYNPDVVTVDGQVKKTLKLDFIACDFIMTSEGFILATDAHKPSIHKLTKEGDKTETLSTAPVRPVTLCEARDGNILVTLIDKPSFEVDKSSRRLVSRITMSGTTVESYEYHNGSRLFTWPEGISENINKDICVVDVTSPTSGRLTVLDQAGKLKLTYEGQKLRESFSPYDVVCDKSGHIIVSDRHNNKVHILNIDGQFIRYVVDENILKDNPVCLALDRDGVLWVGGNKGNVYRIKYLK